MIVDLTALELAGLVLSAEFALVACAVPAALLARERRRTRDAAAQAAQLLAETTADAPTRHEALSDVFSNAFQLEGDDLDARVGEFVAREQAFYRAMTSVYLDRDECRLAEIPAQLTSVVAPWIDLAASAATPAVETEDLAAVNASLSAELDRTREHLESLLREYAKAFRQSAQAVVAAAPDTTPEGRIATPAATARASRAAPEIDVSLDEVAATTADAADDEAAALEQLFAAEIDLGADGERAA